MLSVNTNFSSLIVRSNLNKSTSGLNQAIERMTTGFKINHSKDNAANYSISTNISTQLSSYEVALENTVMGLDLISTASDSLDLITSHLQRIRDLSEQAANGTYGKDSLKAIQSEVDARSAEIERIMANTEYNGIKLFNAENKRTPIINGKEVVLTKDGFMQEINRRDTSSMISVSTLADDAKITGGIYKIETREDLEKLIKIGDRDDGITGGEFVLASDIDASGLNAINYAHNIIFDGNGYSILNQTDGLLAELYDSEVKNLALKDVNILSECSPLAGSVQNSNISNCYATGQIKDTLSFVFGGLITSIEDSTIDCCWTDVDIEVRSIIIGGIAGGIAGSTISNSFSLGKVINTIPEDFAYDGHGIAGGIVGMTMDDSTIENCYTSSTVSSFSKDLEYIIASNCIESDIYPLTITNVTYDASANPDTQLYGSSMVTVSGVKPADSYRKAASLIFQVGIHSDTNSQINIGLDFDFSSVSVNVLSSDSARSSLDKIDKMLANISSKQTEYGAAQNRLESAAESIGVSIENLTSTRSTLRDADVAEESSSYIKNQILEQAAATLLATANQSPAVALQLI